MIRPAISICLLLCLPACGGGGGGGGGDGGSGIDPRLARLDIYEAQKLRVLGDPGAGVMGMPVTAAENVPLGGAMVFAGSATMRVEVEDQPLVLFGDADLRVDFDAGNAEGAIDTVFGTNASGAVVDYDGAIAMESATAGQDMPLTYAGTLSASGQALGFAGTMTGVLLGNPVVAFSAADLEAVVDQSGVARDATLVVTMEQTP